MAMAMTKRKPECKPANRVPSTPIPLYVLSDSTGNLARHMVASFLTQFPAGSFQVLTKPFVGQADRISRALEAIRIRPGIVFHAVVSHDLKKRIDDHCREINVPSWDLTGSTVDFLVKASKIQQEPKPRSLHPVDSAYCGRINAMSFTLEHDDGLGLDTLSEADVVLVGVSRTGKTPTSMFLAMQGFRVANVSVVMGVTPPKELFTLDPKKIIGLLVHPFQLAEIRTRRRAAWRMGNTLYNEPREIAEEIKWSRRLFADLHCITLDVTDQAIEETAAKIIDVLNLPEPATQTQPQELI
jgi:[pyruvate, water dikinase]-phosphate phosphotransferase / [pyruvate, water dikinase] kinase